MKKHHRDAEGTEKNASVCSEALWFIYYPPNTTFIRSR